MTDFLKRPRRIRQSAALRDLVRETHVRRDDLIAPLFVRDGTGDPTPVESMPGIYRYTIPQLVEECRRLWDGGIKAVALFPVVEPSLKDAGGSYGLDEKCFLYEAVRQVKAAVPGLVVINDVALDPFTDHGHDGVLNPAGTDVDNDATVVRLAKIAVIEGKAGCDIVAPSDMMDGRVLAIRRALDAAEMPHVGILSYAAKFASALYGPFRDAVGSKQAAGTAHLDKRTYQVSPENGREAVKDALLDEAEGADILMVKPAGWYLDIIANLRRETRLPIAAYQISGEYAKIHAAARLGWLDLDKARDESLLAIKRAGADMILTYFAQELAAQK
jgi:porphobilinogen synthase